jgi:hypothetical protein
MKQRVIAVSGTATVEAVEANVEAQGFVYGVKALSAVFAVNWLRRCRRLEGSIVNVLASGHIQRRVE